MLARIFVIALSVMAMPAFARVVAESETGFVFGDPNCRLVSFGGAKLGKIAPDYFDYLTAVVTVKFTCVTHDGRRWVRQAADRVEFLTPEFNWESQAWETNGTWLAEKIDDLNIGLNPELDLFVWTDPRVEGIAFKVQFKTRPAIP